MKQSHFNVAAKDVEMFNRQLRDLILHRLDTFLDRNFRGEWGWKRMQGLDSDASWLMCWGGGHLRTDLTNHFESGSCQIQRCAQDMEVEYILCLFHFCLGSRPVVHIHTCFRPTGQETYFAPFPFISIHSFYHTSQAIDWRPTWSCESWGFRRKFHKAAISDGKWHIYSFFMAFRWPSERIWGKFQSDQPPPT